MRAGSRRVIHPSSVAVSREHRRAKTDRLDTELLKRAFLGWLRGERGHCSMARVPTIAEEDAKRPNRERECLVGERTRIVNRMKGTLARLGIRNFKPTLRKAADRLATLHTPEGMPLPPNVLAELQRAMARLGFVVSQIREIEQARQKRLEQQPETGPHAMVRQLSRVVGVGIETADMLVHEVLSRPMRDRKAVARYAGLTGSPDESGTKRREQGLARAGNARVRRGMIQLAWRFLLFQKDSALALWYRARTADSRVLQAVALVMQAQIRRRYRRSPEASVKQLSLRLFAAIDCLIDPRHQLRRQRARVGGGYAFRKFRTVLHTEHVGAVDRATSIPRRRALPIPRSRFPPTTSLRQWL
jgi:transposase